MKKTITILSILFVFCFQNSLYADVRTSAQSGYYSVGSTWIGGVAPGPGDDIVIASGHTVTLDVNAVVTDITIQSGAILDNGTFNVVGYNVNPGIIPLYANDGTHNGQGKFILTSQGRTQLSGNGITNCSIEMLSYGLEILSTCNLTINGDIQQGNGSESPTILEASQGGGGNLTINGDIVTIPSRGGSILNNMGTINVNGNVSLGGTASGSGSVLENHMIFNISGDLTLGPYSSYCDNFGSMTIGGSLTGDFDTYFIQEANSNVKFGGSVFASDDGFLFAVESPIYGSSIPNTIEYNGIVNQNITLPADMSYSNLVISNINATAAITTDIMVNGDLTIKPGSALTVGTGGSLSVSGSLTLESDVTGTGSFIPGSAISANIQRYISGHDGNANDGWHFLGSPVTAQPIGTFHTPGSGDDFYKWDEPSSTWINRTAEGGGLNGSFETNFTVGAGYLIAIQESDTKIFTGTINTTDVNISGMSYTGISPFTGWHLVGNPFSCAMHWNDGNWALNNVDANAQVWNETNASYSVIAATEVIPAMNGFMVHASQDNASLTIPASSRVHSNTAWYKNTLQNDRIVLTAIDSEGGTAQPSILRFDGNATEDYDNQYDSYFLPGFAPNFYSVTQNEKFALNTLPELTGGLTIPLGFQKNSSSRFSIELTENIPGQAVYLTDLTTSVTINLAEGSYSFDAGEDDEANRFLLHFSTLGIKNPIAGQNPEAWVYDRHLYLLNAAPGSASIFDLQGRLLRSYRIESSGLQANPVNLPSGAYLVRLQGKASVKSVKVIVQ